MVVDSAKLEAAISGNINGVANLAAAYGKAIQTATDGLVGTSGIIVARTDGIQASIKGLGKQSDALLVRLTQIEARYRKQFTACLLYTSRCV